MEKGADYYGLASRSVVNKSQKTVKLKGRNTLGLIIQPKQVLLVHTGVAMGSLKGFKREGGTLFSFRKSSRRFTHSGSQHSIAAQQLSCWDLLAFI